MKIDQERRILPCLVPFPNLPNSNPHKMFSSLFDKIRLLLGSTLNFFDSLFDNYVLYVMLCN